MRLSREERAKESWFSLAGASLKMLGMALALVGRVSPLLLILMVAVSLFQALLAPVELMLVRRATDQLAGDLANPAAVSQMWQWLIPLAVLLAITLLLQPAATLVRTLLSDRVGHRLNHRVIQACNSWPGIKHFEDSTTIDDLENARYRSVYLLNIIASTMSALMTMVTIIAVGVTLGSIHPIIPIALAIAHLPLMATSWRYESITGESLAYLTPQTRRLHYLREMTVSPQPAKDIRLAGANPYLAERYERVWRTSIGELHRERIRLMWGMQPMHLLATASLLIIFGVLVWQTSAGAVSIGALIMYASGAITLSATLQLLAGELAWLAFPLKFLESIKRILELGPDLPVPTNPTTTNAPLSQGITFDNVSFRYPGRDTDTLKGVSFSLAPTTSVALVGNNGSGKTTVIKLLLRLYDPTGGRILLDGVDIRDIDPVQLRERMGVIFQDFGRYELTAAENVGVGALDRQHDRDLLNEAARLGGATTVIEQLPDGWDTNLGRELGERELSGGQWQRIALSRAFLSNSDVLVLDEPTAELDPRAEYEIFQRFTALTKDRMTVLISHRLSTVRMAQRILLLSDGVIAENGDHAALLAANGEYARIYRLQAQQYVDNDPLSSPVTEADLDRGEPQ